MDLTLESFCAHSKLICFEACNLLVAVDQTVYEGGEGFPENLKTDDNLLRQKVIVALSFTEVDIF